MTKSTPEENKKHRFLADLRREWQADELSDVQVARLESLGISKYTMRDAVPGVNDLATMNPALASQWHPSKNGDLTPQQVMAGSGRKVWWRCEKDHEWEATIASRSNGNSCPYCSGKKALPGANDLATVNPELAAQWHPVKNKPLTPQGVTAKSGKKIWWLGPCGHEWEATIASRSNGTGCPYCAGRKVLPGVNDLATAAPDLAAEWHPTKNGDLTPRDVTAGSNKKVWWLGECGHEWEATIASRASNGNSCPYCAGQRILSGFNDLATVNPGLAAQWHTTKNGDLTPQDVTAGSGKKIWWQCDKGHEWNACVVDRSNGSGCPVCARNSRKKKGDQR